ncbi:related to Pre-mRNA splicing factor cwc22 [Ustilago trichophora]|uniref:Related to Pre-mRNA splicing factor cwc22 n=1 Tax=Ustilago trichophora TaxID=86804 RepID=A0A5C3ED38_9BASI|nr:related to Pre-mRNA splicing factor cwc22 [Ustilago trichophora]
MPSKDRSPDSRSSAMAGSSRSPSPEASAALKRKRSTTRSPSSASISSRSLSRSRSPPPRSRRRRSSRDRSPSYSSDEEKVAKHKASQARKAQEEEAKAKQTAVKGEALRSTLAQLSTTKAGGAYIPPARLKALMAEAAAADPGSVEYQRMSWDALKKSITGLVNKVAAENIKSIVPELFGGANLIRGRGLYCRSIMRAQALSLSFTPVFAALTAIVNTKLPMVGELLVTRLVSQFRRSFKRNDKPVCNSTAMFLAHLVNQRVVHEVLALEILVLLLEKPTDDSVEIAVGFMREVGAFLSEEAPKANNSIFDRFRAVLYEGGISKRVQYMIEVLSQVRREGFKDHPRIPESLDLVEEDDQITHRISLDDQLNVEEGLNVFKKDPEFVENEERYRSIKAEILGEDEDSHDSGSDADSESGSSDESEQDDQDDAQRQLEIHDRTETNLINLRRTIYLTIMSSLDFEESVHKLLKLEIPEDQDIELCNMIVECCSQERTYSKFYGNMGERLCKLHRKWSETFAQSFTNYYDTIHRYETNRLRNIARFFGHLFSTDSISWASLSVVHMNEEDTTSSSRIFIKILFQEMQQQLGLKELTERFKEPSLQDDWQGLFPKDNPKSTRFSINYFTSIGLGVLTEDMREHLKNAPKILLAQRQAALAARGSDDSDTDSSSILSTSSGSRSRSSYSSRSLSSRSYSSKSYSSRSYSSRSRSRSRSRSYSSRSRSRSYSSRSRSRSYSRSPSRSRSSSPRRHRGRSRTRSASCSSYSSRSRSRSRSYSRSVSPRRRSLSRSRSRSRSRSLSRSPYVSKSRAPRSRSQSLDARPQRNRRSPSRSIYSGSESDASRSRSPPARATRRRERSPSYSRSPSPSRRK